MFTQMNKTKTINFLRIFLAIAFTCGLLTNTLQAQSGRRYAEPVFDEVNTIVGIPYSSAVKEGDTLPTTLYLDFYEPVGDTLPKRPLVITVFGGAFVAGSRDFIDMQEYCTRLAQHGYAAASIDYRLLSIWNLNQTSLIRDAYMAAQDVSSAIRFFKYHYDEYRIDTEQVFLLGNSAGSIAILCELFMDEDERPVETSEEPDLGSMHSSGFEEYAGFSPAVAGAIPQWGGVMDLDVIDEEEYVPLCMLHGTDDTNVPYDSGYCYNGMLPGVMPYMYGSHPIAGRLDEIGITDYEFHSFEGEGHAFYFTLSYQLNEKFDTCFNIVRDFLYQHLNLSTSVPETEELKIQVYPNPSNGVFNIKTGGETAITIYNLMGQTVATGKTENGVFTVSNLSSGVYFVKSGEGMVQKVVVE